jgi:hypothetical protein
MKIATIIARSLLGLIFVVFGSNMFLNFIPMPIRLQDLWTYYWNITWVPGPAPKTL